MLSSSNCGAKESHIQKTRTYLHYDNLN